MLVYREEKSLRHVAMVAKFLDDNKPKTSPKKKFTILNFIDRWRNFLGLNPKGPYLSLEEEKGNFRVVFTYSIKPERVKLGSFMSQGRNDGKEIYNIACCTCKFVFVFFFANKNLYFFAALLPSPSSLVLLLSRNSATMVM